MTVPDPSRPTSGMDPMPRSRPRAPFPGDLPPHDPPGDIPELPGRPDGLPDPGRPRRGSFVALGREDGARHLVDVPLGEAGDPVGLSARCGAPVEQVVPSLRAEQADCPVCGVGAAPVGDPGRVG